MTANAHTGSLGTELQAGGRHYKAFVGPAEHYDLVSATQFNLLTLLGLREHHSLLDIGCGSLRGGKLFIPYLLPGRYFGIEPEQWLIDEGVKHELGSDLIRIKRPVFSDDNNFSLSVFERNFDFILAQSIFSHASQQQIRRCLSEAKRVMEPTSVFAATFCRGATNYEGTDWVYPGSVTYTLEYMLRLVEEEGLVCREIRWPHPNQQTWIAVGTETTLAGLPKLLWSADLWTDLSSFWQRSDEQAWLNKVRLATQEIGALIPDGIQFILVDEHQWATTGASFGGRRIPFLERDGQYWGRPPDDATAIEQLERLRQVGAGFVVFAWPAFWWLDYYLDLHRHLRSTSRCVLENERLLVFDLRL